MSNGIQDSKRDTGEAMESLGVVCEESKTGSMTERLWRNRRAEAAESALAQAQEMLMDFVRFAESAPRLDFHEDRTLMWIAVMAEKARALTAGVKESLTTESAIAQALKRTPAQETAVSAAQEGDKH